MWNVTSPNGRVILSVGINTGGGLFYSVSKNGQAIIEQGILGIATDLGDFTAELEFDKAETTGISETYTIPVGKKDKYENNANELTLFFTQKKALFMLRLRSYDNGVAFRYEIPSSEAGILVHYETTDFRFTDSFTRLWLQDWVASYEGPYNATTWGIGHDGRRYGMPSLIHSPEQGRWVMINEANVLNKDGAYCISHLRGTVEAALQLAFAPEEGGKPINSRLPFESPWRYLLIEDSLDGIVNATMNYNLNPPSVIEDTSWIKPARAVWAWWASDFGAQLLTEAAEYVDFAQAMGFEAVLLDAGWDYSWIKEFCDYAHARGISPWLWSAMQYLNTPEKSQELLPLWKSLGIDGVKIDFYENDSAHTASCYQLNADVMREQKLMINFHGSTKPMGEGRTWPHLMTCEGIMGMEYYKWSDGPNAEHNCTVPFIRNAAGPMDYTPVGFSNKNRNTTMAHQMALAAVFESGCQHYAASIYQLEAWEGTDFLRRLTPKYSGVKVLSGYPGQYATVLRWDDKTAEWIIGCITNESRVVTVAFDFLPVGEFEAEVYGDTRMGDEITYQKITVDRSTKLDLVLPEHGGAGVYIAKVVKPLTLETDSGYMCRKRFLVKPEEMRLIHGSERLIFSETKSAVLLSGGASFTVAHLPKQKRYTIRFFYSAEKPGDIAITDGKSDTQIHILGNIAAGTFTTAQTTMVLGEGLSRLTIRKVNGETPIIKQIAIIDNNPPEVMTVKADEAFLSGGAELAIRPDGSYMATGVGLGGEMLFDPVAVNATGKYILRINYFAGVDGLAWVAPNQGEPIRANLGGVGGWGQTRRGEYLAREILLDLRKGCNTLRIFNQEGALPYIHGISLTPFQV